MQEIKDRLKGLGLTDSTIRTYCYILNQFFNHTKKVNNFTEQEINNYLDYLIVAKNYKARSRNLHSKVIRFYCREFLSFNLIIKKAKEDKPIPKIVEDAELNRILAVTKNPKHKLCLLLMRYSGLRRWEVIRLMKHHILSDGRILVKNGKGMKDRFTILPLQILEQLKCFMDLLPVDNPYVFQGQYGGHYNKRTPQAILDNAFIKLSWNKERWFGCHALRHSFTIWALDNRIGDYDEVSKWLGHSVTQTTQIYTKCRKINIQQAVERCEKLVIMQ